MNINPIPESTIEFISPFDFKSMYDLGNKKTGKIPYSIYYRELGIEYDSIDLNGKDGALKLDLTKPIDLKPRDVVMNLGTSEHILNQEAVFRNIHNLSNYRMIHQVPIKGSRPGHGYWGYTYRFFKMLAVINDYEIIKMEFEERRQIICVSFKHILKTNFKWDRNLLNLFEGTFLAS